MIIFMINIKSYGSGSKGNMYIVSSSTTNIILECGIPEESMLKVLNANKLNRKNISAVFTSHAHRDHSLTINYFDFYNIKCYTTYETYLKYDLSDDNFVRLEDNKIYKIGDIQILAFRVFHGKTDCFGFIFKDKEDTILFITDFMECAKNLSKFKFTQVFIECNYLVEEWEKASKKTDLIDDLKRKYERQLNTHMSLDNLMTHLDYMDLTKCKKITLIHTSEDLGNRDIMKNAIIDKYGINCVCLLSNGKEY